METTETLLENYYQWLKQRYSVHHLDKRVDEIVTPFVDNINDNLSIYLERLPGDRIRLSDDGYTLDSLEMMGLDLTTTRKTLALRVLSQFKVSMTDDGVLSLTGNVEDFPLMKFRLTSAIVRINDLVFTQRENNSRPFADEVLNFFQTNDFGGIKTSLTGASGVDYSFQYAIPKHRKRPLILFDINNSLTRNTVMLGAFKYNDIRKDNHFFNTYHNQSKYIIIYNGHPKHPGASTLKIANTNDICLISWQEKNQLTEIIS